MRKKISRKTVAGVGVLLALVGLEVGLRQFFGFGHPPLSHADPDMDYRCNTVWRLRRTLARYGFDGIAYGYEAEPSYLNFSRVAYALGVLHQKLAPGFIRPAIFVFAQRS